MGGKIRYLHNGSQNHSDWLYFTVSDGNTRLAKQKFTITVTEAIDQPTSDTDADTEYDYDRATDTPIGDNKVTKDDVEEGGTYVFKVSDLYVYDPDTPDPADILYIIWTLPPTTQGVLQKNVGTSTNPDWQNAVVHPNPNPTSFTLADLMVGKVRYVHNPDENPVSVTFDYLFKNSGGPNTNFETVTIDVKPLNDAPERPDLRQPTDTNLNITRIDPTTAAAGDVVAVLYTDDEETTDQAAFTYELVSGEGDTHNDYFDVVRNAAGTGWVLKFKDDLGSLKLRLEGENYNIRLQVKDVAVGD